MDLTENKQRGGLRFGWVGAFLFSFFDYEILMGNMNNENKWKGSWESELEIILLTVVRKYLLLSLWNFEILD